jgi:tetratricopeptide (TPR) repeat protein
MITKDPIAIAICRILNDFKPLDTIVRSLWDASDEDAKFLYLCISLAQHCFWAGLRYSHLQAIEGPKSGISNLFDSNNPLRVTSHPVDKEFVIATNSIIAERILLFAEKNEREMLFKSFKEIAIVLAPHVNRKAVIRKSPEARLAGRLFDADKIVKPLLHDKAEQFYIDVKKQWEWNSRYWEQRALLTASDNIDNAVQYGRHAISIERHSYPLTTLGKLLFIKMEQNAYGKDGIFREALRYLDEAIKIESGWVRMTVHPFITALNGTIKYLQSGGNLLDEDAEQVESFVRKASLNFPNDPIILTGIATLSKLMS